MQSSAVLRRLAIKITDVSEERFASIIKITRIGELEMLAVTRTETRYEELLFLILYPEDGCNMFLRNVGSYKTMYFS
jgi:hypothetical protein